MSSLLKSGASPSSTKEVRKKERNSLGGWINLRPINIWKQERVKQKRIRYIESADIKSGTGWGLYKTFE